jgi:hypothetical protein
MGVNAGGLDRETRETDEKREGEGREESKEKTRKG